jgi:uncharacterized protein YybS (DUF2232 family)
MGQVQNLETEKGLLFHSGMIRSIAILSGTLLFVALVPFFGSVTIILSPLPILYYYARLGRMRGLVVVVASSFLVSMTLSLLEHPMNLPVLVMIAYTGVIIAEVLKKKYSLDKSILSASLALFVIVIAFIGYRAFQTGILPWQLVENHVANLIRENIKIYTQLNIADEQIRLISENVLPITDFFTGIFPALALSGAVITVCVNVMAVRRLLQKSGTVFPDFGDLALWKAPEKLVWVLIAAGGMLLAPLDPLNTIGMNLLIVSCLIYLFQGLAILGFFFRKKEVPVVFRWLLYFLILIQQYLLVLVIALGLFDIWVDFRKRIAGIKDVPA